MRGLILGFDGVLVHERPVQAEVLRRVLSEEGLGLSEARALAILEDRGPAVGDQQLVTRALDAAGADGPSVPALVPRLAARLAAYYQMRLRTDGHRPVEGAKRLVEQAHERGWMLALLSSSPRAEVESALERLGVQPLFKTVVAGVDIEASAFQDIWQQLNSRPPLPSRLLHPHEVLVLSASPRAVEAAVAAGLVAVGLSTRHPASSLAAERVIDHPGELLAPIKQ